MRTDRRVNPHRGAGIAFFVSQRAVNVLAHAMEPLELELAHPLLTLRQRHDRGDGVSVVRGESGIDQIACRQQPFGAGEIGHVGRDLAGEDGEILISADLAEFDLGIPVSTLDQAHEQLAPVAPRQLRGPVAQGNAALLIGLDGEAEAGPAACRPVREQAVIGDQRFEDVE